MLMIVRAQESELSELEKEGPRGMAKGEKKESRYRRRTAIEGSIDRRERMGQDEGGDARLPND